MEIQEAHIIRCSECKKYIGLSEFKQGKDIYCKICTKKKLTSEIKSKMKKKHKKLLHMPYDNKTHKERSQSG